MGDEYARCDIHFGLDSVVSPGSIDLKNRSYLWVKGRYDQPAASRLFLRDSGTLVIDSVTSSRLYATLSGVYVNAEKLPLRFDGQFRVKIRD
jgi:hypothetical protein